jgi:hypothetical protein
MSIRQTRGGRGFAALRGDCQLRRDLSSGFLSVYFAEKAPAIFGSFVFFEGERVPIDSISLRTSSM